ncbi:MAG: thioesterase family protein [Gammaproteobacteria bacterium]|jgi:predicted thioesterase
MSDPSVSPSARIEIGATLTRDIEVVEELTVGYSVAGMPLVFATPQMIHHMEVVCAGLIADLLPPDWVSVGTRVEVEHLAATPVGLRVATTATVAAVTDRIVTFDVSAHDGIDVIGRGRHCRGLVAMERFLAGMARKQAGGR